MSKQSTFEKEWEKCGLVEPFHKNIARDFWLASKKYWLRWALRQKTTEIHDGFIEGGIDPAKIKAEISKVEKEGTGK
jgi:hypothetical protein